MKNEHTVVCEGSLNGQTCDNFLRRVAQCAEDGDKRKKVQIDLSDLGFIGPYGLVCLYLAVRHLGDFFKKVVVVFPNDIFVKSYMVVMKFPECTDGFVDIQNLEGCEFAEVLITNDILLPLTGIKGDKDSQENITEPILLKLKDILQDELHYDETNIVKLSTIVSELCYNIIDHSEDEGVLAVQRYRRHNDGRRFLIVGVGDLGIGIKNSLGKRYDVSDWSHLDAIIYSLKKNTSRKVDRGFGLYSVKKITEDYEGSLHVRSGNSRLYFRSSVHGFDSGLFPGTQVLINLSEQES